jgi:hypothetical protein
VAKLTQLHAACDAIALTNATLNGEMNESRPFSSSARCGRRDAACRPSGPAPPHYSYR